MNAELLINDSQQSTANFNIPPELVQLEPHIFKYNPRAKSMKQTSWEHVRAEEEEEEAASVSTAQMCSGLQTQLMILGAN